MDDRKATLVRTPCQATKRQNTDNQNSKKQGTFSCATVIFMLRRELAMMGIPQQDAHKERPQSAQSQKQGPPSVSSRVSPMWTNASEMHPLSR